MGTALFAIGRKTEILTTTTKGANDSTFNASMLFWRIQNIDGEKALNEMEEIRPHFFLVHKKHSPVSAK